MACMCGVRCRVVSGRRILMRLTFRVRQSCCGGKLEETEECELDE
jgi:hypothetical protein